MHAPKAPGPDDLLFQPGWVTKKNEVISFIQNFFHAVVLPKKVNHSACPYSKKEVLWVSLEFSPYWYFVMFFIELLQKSWLIDLGLICQSLSPIIRALLSLGETSGITIASPQNSSIVWAERIGEKG